MKMSSLLFSHIWLLSRDEELKPKKFFSKMIHSQEKKEGRRIHFRYMKTQKKVVNSLTGAEQWVLQELVGLKTRLASVTKSNQQHPT